MVNIKEDLEFKLKVPDFLKKFDIETTFLLIFSCFLLAFISVYEGGLIIHGSPYQLIAGDMFTFDAFSEVAKDTNQFSFLPKYMAAGIDNVANLFPQTPGLIVAELALFSGAETHDILLHINIFFLILMIFGSYLALRYVNKELAICGIVLGLLMWKWPFSYIINWGAHMSIMNFFFVVASLVSFFFIKEKFMFIIFGIINAASFMAHGREFQTFNIAIVVFFFIQLVINKFNFKKLDWDCIKKYVLSLIVTIVLLFRYLPIWREFGKYGQSGAARTSFITYCPLSPDSYHYVSFATMGIFKWIVLIGILFAAYLLIKKFNEKPQLGFIIIYSFMYLVSSYFCIYGNKTTQIRHLFPIFLIPLMAIGIYFIVIQFKDRLNGKLLTTVIIISTILMVMAISSQYPKPISDYPVSNPYTWEGLKWIEVNTPENSRVVVLYGDNFYQDTLFYLMKRPFYQVDSEKYLDKINKCLIDPDFDMRFAILGFHWERESLFGLRQITYLGPDGGDLKLIRANLCDFEYIFSNKGSQNVAINEYTQELLKTIVNEGNFIPVFQNELTIILKNNRLGGKCFDEKMVST